MINFSDRPTRTYYKILYLVENLTSPVCSSSGQKQLAKFPQDWNHIDPEPVFTPKQQLCPRGP